MLSFKKETIFSLIMDKINMVVEIPYNSFVKYEYDIKEKIMRCDRVLHTAMAYPGNYGYIPNTLSGDGDPLDVLMICEYPIYPGIIVKARMVGVLFTKDEKGDDEKIIAVPSTQVDPNYSDISNYTDLPKWTLSKIEHFFKNFMKKKIFVSPSKYHYFVEMICMTPKIILNVL